MEISNEQILFCLLLGFCLSYMLIASILDIWQKRGLAARAAEFHHQSTPNARPIPPAGWHCLGGGIYRDVSVAGGGILQFPFQAGIVSGALVFVWLRARHVWLGPVG